MVMGDQIDPNLRLGSPEISGPYEPPTPLPDLVTKNAELNKLVIDLQMQLFEAKQLFDQQKAVLQAQLECYQAKTALTKKILQGLQTVLVGAHWPTSITGYAFAFGIALYPVLQAGRLPTGSELIQAAAFAVLGRFAKSTHIASSAPAISKLTSPSAPEGAST
jgi:hypothetical protein